MSTPNLLEEIEKLLKNEVVERHSFFQLKYFVIGKEPTHQSRLWRCLRELESRKESIEGIILEIENTKDKIKLLEIQINKKKPKAKPKFSESSWDLEEKYDEENEVKEIKIRMLERNKLSLNRTVSKLQKKLKFAQEEAEFLYQAYLSLEQKELIKPFDDFESQLNYWNEKLSQALNLKLLLHQPPDPELISTILALDNKATVKNEVTSLLNNIQGKLEKDVKNIESR